jgi:hypothetical protein
MSAACAGAWSNDAATIRHRQQVLKDCLANPKFVRELHVMAGEPFGRDQGWRFGLYGHNAASQVCSGVHTLEACLELLRKIRETCAANAGRFSSPGFTNFFATLQRNIDDAYLAAARSDLEILTFREGSLLNAKLGDGGKGVAAKLRRPQPRDLSWMHRILARSGRSSTLQLHPRDDAGAQAFGELQDRGLTLISDAVYRSAEHVFDFLKALRAETAFYVGCLNLKERLDRIGETICFPEAQQQPGRFRCRNLRDVCLSLTLGHAAAGNDVDANGKPLLIITGANRGGKSTFLRSVGLAALMLQCGMFVTADSFSASLHTGLFTHLKREEDRDMCSGKFDEELVRMSAIADQIRQRALILFNESFAATHEKEGAEIARQIVTALLDSGVDVLFVSHMYEFARSFFDDDRVLFLRADRGDGDRRSFRLRAAKPLPTSFGADLYDRILGSSATTPKAARAGLPATG